MSDWAQVDLVEMMGSDRSIAENAWVCTQRGKGSTKEDMGRLLDFLAQHGHGTPFETVVFRLQVSCPIFVARQWMRHRMSSYNERSMRYVHLKEGMQFFDMPEGVFPESQAQQYGTICRMAEELYHSMIEQAENKRRARELARAVLPQGMFTKFIWTVNLRSLANFIWHRSADGAQEEIKVYSEKIKELLKGMPELELAYKSLEKAEWKI